MFLTRFFSGVLLIALALVFISTGGPVLAAALCFISLAAYRELGKATGIIAKDKSKRALEYTGMILTVLYYIGLCYALRWYPGPLSNGIAAQSYAEKYMYRGLAFGIIIAFIVYLFIYVFRFPDYHANEIMTAYFSFLYGPVMLSFLYLIRDGLYMGRYLVWFVFLCSWGSDTCAYCVGILFGKHKMTPKLSPKKSIEGAIAGIAGAALLFALYIYLVEKYFVVTSFGISMPGAMVLGAVGALVSMIGDLAASAIKRDHNIKDYGKLIPGHGGIMDRFDSVIVAAPLIFIGLSLMISF